MNRLRAKYTDDDRSVTSLERLNRWASTITPRVVRTLWTLCTPLATYSCDLVDHGVYGVEAKIFRGMRFLASWRFESEALAAAWAAEEREDIRQHECLDEMALVI